MASLLIWVNLKQTSFQHFVTKDFNSLWPIFQEVLDEVQASHHCDGIFDKEIGEPT